MDWLRSKENVLLMIDVSPYLTLIPDEIAREWHYVVDETETFDPMKPHWALNRNGEAVFITFEANSKKVGKNHKKSLSN